jgi:hypothetical protein
MSENCSACPQCKKTTCDVYLKGDTTYHYTCGEHTKNNFYCDICKSCYRCFESCDGCDGCTYCSFIDTKFENFKCQFKECDTVYCKLCYKNLFYIDEKMCTDHTIEKNPKYLTLIKVYLELFFVDKINKDIVNIISEYYV